MGTLTAGIKEIFSSAKTTGSNVMLCGNDGTPDGHITMSNLANVLGAGTLPLKNLPENTNLQTFHKNVPEGVHLYNCTQDGTINKPIGEFGGIMLVLSRGVDVYLKSWFELYIPADEDEALGVLWRNMKRSSLDTKEWKQL